MTSNKPETKLSKSSLLILHCKCGHQILLLPDHKIMGKVIEEHAIEHKNKYGLTQEETERIKDNLIAQAFKLICEVPK